jgi:hypothetical protein
MNTNMGSREKLCYIFSLRWIVKKCFKYDEIWRSTERYCQYSGRKFPNGHFEEATVLCFPHGITPMSLKANVTMKGGELMKNGLKKRLMSFLRAVYNESSNICLSQRTGRGSWIVLVGPVKYEKGKKKQEDMEEEKKRKEDSCRTEVFGAIEYCLGEEGCFIGMHHCIGRGIEEENLVVSESDSLVPV